MYVCTIVNRYDKTAKLKVDYRWKLELIKTNIQLIWHGCQFKFITKQFLLFSLIISDPNEESLVDWPTFTVPELEYLMLDLNSTVGRALKAKQCAFWNDYMVKLQTFAGTFYHFFSFKTLYPRNWIILIVEHHINFISCTWVAYELSTQKTWTEHRMKLMEVSN